MPTAPTQAVSHRHDGDASQSDKTGLQRQISSGIRKSVLAVTRLLAFPLWQGPHLVWRIIWPLLTALHLQIIIFVPWLLAGLGAYLCYIAQGASTSNVGAHAAFISSPLRALHNASETLRQSIDSWSNHPDGAGLIGCVFGLYMGLFIFSTLGLAPLHAALVGLPRRRLDTSHGAAAWGTLKHAKKAGYLHPLGSKRGLLLGRFQTHGMWHRRTIDSRFRLTDHIITFARTGAGKGVGCVIPNLLSYPGSLLCLDVKGENYAVTARARMQMGQAVARLDPFGLSGKPTHRFNWFDMIDAQSEEGISDAAMLADTLVVRDQEGESHWDDSAAALLRGLILYVATLPRQDRHAKTLRELLTDNQHKLMALLKLLGEDSTLAHGVVARAAHAFLNKEDRERSGVLSTAVRHTDFLDDPRIQRSLVASDFDFADLKRRQLSIYVMLSPDMLTTYSRYVRATFALALRAMATEKTIPSHDVLFVLDEFASLKRFAPIQERLTVIRGYHVRLWLVFQNQSQLKSLYRDWETFLGSCVAQYFGTQDLGTMQYISNLLGQTTLRVKTSGQSSSHGKSASQSVSNHEQLVGRALLLPNEVRELGKNKVIVIVPAEPPFLLERLNYLTDPETRGLADANPFELNRLRR